jgi:hypothetical protein
VDSQIPDLLEFHKPIQRGQKIYFAEKYNTESVCNGGIGSLFGGQLSCWRQLLMDLELSGMKQGFHLLGNGCGHKRHIVCQGSCMYQGPKQDQRSPSTQQYRKETLHCDCMLNREASPGRLCHGRQKQVGHWIRIVYGPFVSLLQLMMLDSIILLVESVTHRTKLTPSNVAIPTRPVNVAEKDLIVSVASAKANDVGRNLHFVQSGFVMPQTQV